MTVIIESKKMKITQAIRSFTEKQALKISKLGKSVLDIKVHLETVAKKKMDKSANIVTYFISIPGKDIVVKSKSYDMYEAIVKATESAVRKLRKVSEKRQTVKRARISQKLATS